MRQPNSVGFIVELPAHSAPRMRAAVQLAGLSLLACAVAAPQIAIAIEALSRAEMRASLAAQPLVACELAIALQFWIALFIWPMSLLYRALTCRRWTAIRDRTVFVSESRGRSILAWSQPLSAYAGISHRIRSSHSGIRHEAWLEHPNKTWSLPIMVAEHISETDLACICEALELPRLSRTGTAKARSQTPQCPAPSLEFVEVPA